MTRRFFLLIGILVILTIMVLLSGIALPYYIGHIETAKVRKAGQETKILAQTAKAYYRDNRDYPNVL